METQGGLSKQQDSFIVSMFILQYFKVNYLTLRTIGTGLCRNFETGLAVMVHVKGFHQHLLEVVNDRVMGISVTR